MFFFVPTFLSKLSREFIYNFVIIPTDRQTNKTNRGDNITSLVTVSNASLTQTLMKRYLLTLGSNSTGSSGARANDTCNGFSVKLISGRVLLRFLKVGRLSNTKPMYRLATSLSVRSVATASPSRLVSLLNINSLGKFNTGISHCMLFVAISLQRYSHTHRSVAFHT